jgi:hypothetical protein
MGNEDALDVGNSVAQPEEIGSELVVRVVGGWAWIHQRQCIAWDEIAVHSADAERRRNIDPFNPIQIH